jgi:hypothetical protein
MERKRLESAATDYSYLRGLFGIPLGVLAIVSALGNWEWGPFSHAWAFFVAVGLVAAMSLLINRYYKEHYGRVTLTKRQQVRTIAVSLLVAPLVIAGAFLLRSRVDWSLDLPVNPTAAMFAVLLLSGYAASVGLRAHHVAIWGSILVAALLPVWNGGDPSNIGLVMGGVGIIACGIFDHRLLARAFSHPDELRLEDSGVRA